MIKRTEQIKLGVRQHWASILVALGVPAQYLDGRHHPCPACGGKDRFRYDGHFKDSGSHFCNGCGHGDGFDLLMKLHLCDFRQALTMVEQWLGGSFVEDSTSPYAARPVKVDEPDQAKYQKFLKHWQSGRPVTASDPAGRYLTNRGIEFACYPEALRYHPEAWTNDPSGELRPYPALLAGFTEPNGRIVQVQRVFLTPDGRKAFVNCKKLMPSWKPGVMRGGAIRLFDADDTMGVAEGVETAMSARIIYNLPVWACLSAKLMELFEPPANIKRVVIFADNDASNVGQKAARLLQQRLKTGRLEVQIIKPNAVGTDFNDVLINAKTA